MTPIKPINRPIKVDRLLKLMLQLWRSSSTNQIGAAETRIATIALGNVCSTHITQPLPPPKSKIPTTAEVIRLFLLNIFSRLKSAQISISVPAVKKRIAPINKGGKPCMAILIKK